MGVTTFDTLAVLEVLLHWLMQLFALRCVFAIDFEIGLLMAV
jgi:hypothetical protein